MATRYPDLFAALAAPFRPEEVKVFSKNNKQIHYTTARTVMNRLDNVLGPENWWDDYTPGEHSVLCRLSVRLPDGSVLTKSDAGGYAGMADEGDDDKSGYSDAFKRAGVKFGVARYLYRDGVPAFVAEHAHAGPGHREPFGPALDNPRPPLDVLPSQAVPSRTTPADLGWVHRAPAVPSAVNGSHSNGNGQAPPRIGKPVVTVDAPEIPDPRTGGQLFKFLKVMEEREGFGSGLIKYLNGWAKLQGFSGRIVDWDGDTVRLALVEARRKLAEAAGRGEAYDEAQAN